MYTNAAIRSLHCALVVVTHQWWHPRCLELSMATFMDPISPRNIPDKKWKHVLQCTAMYCIAMGGMCVIIILFAIGVRGFLIRLSAKCHNKALTLGSTSHEWPRLTLGGGHTPLHWRSLEQPGGCPKQSWWADWCRVYSQTSQDAGANG